MSLPERFWANVATTDCIVWQGAQNSKGYGYFSEKGVSRLAHRLAWEDARGPIPDGMTIDHLCRVRACVNIDHMEVVTTAENNIRKRIKGGLQLGGECVHGHAITLLTLYRRPNGEVDCRVCRAEQKRNRTARAS